MENPYLPFSMRIDDIVVETEDHNIKTFVLSYFEKEDEDRFKYVPGQFAELTVYGKGEAPFGMASSPMQAGQLEFSVSKIGVLTSALHQMHKGDVVGVRGPLGNGFPLANLKGKNLVLIGGGFGFSTLRALTNYMIHKAHRSSFGDITVIYGARKPGLLLYKGDLESWESRSDIQLHLTVDTADNGWTGHVGLVPNVTKSLAPSAENAFTLICGPPAMIKFTLPVVKELGFPDDKILLSLEMKMKCGVGMCGRCNMGSQYICRDGPVFSQDQLLHLTTETHF
jgi:NAD(P)H-flavin reductase